MNVNRNILIIGGLAIATILALLLINFFSNTRRVTPETSELEQELTIEIEELESSILELELVYQEQGDEIDVMGELLDIKNAQLEEFSERIDQLEAEGKLSRQQIDRLRTRLALAQGQSESREKVNVLVQDISILTRNADSLQIGYERADSMLAVYEALIEEYKKQLADCGGRGSLPESNVGLDASPILFATNLKAFAKAPSGEQLEITRDVKASQIEELRFCFDLSGNKLIDSGTKRVYIVMTNLNKKVLSNPSRGGGTFIANGVSQNYTRLIDVQYIQGRNQRDQCVDFTPSEQIPFGTYQVQLLYEGKTIARKRLFVN